MCTPFDTPNQVGDEAYKGSIKKTHQTARFNFTPWDKEPYMNMNKMQVDIPALKWNSWARVQKLSNNNPLGSPRQKIQEQ